MFDAIIYFTDNTHIIVPDVSSYQWGEVDGAVSVVIGRRQRQFFNMSCVKYIGRVEDIGVENE